MFTARRILQMVPLLVVLTICESVFLTRTPTPTGLSPTMTPPGTNNVPNRDPEWDK